MKRLALSVLAVPAMLLIAGCCLCRPDPVRQPDKYAVLASTYLAESNDVDSNADWWYDLVLTYCTLVDYDFQEENIFALYGKGTDGSSIYAAYDWPFCDNRVSKITDIPLWKTENVAKDNLCNMLCCLSSGRPAKLKNGDCKCRSYGKSGIGGFTCSDHNIPRLNHEDFLITWIKSHGMSTSCDATLGFMEGYYLKDDELKGLFEKLRSDRWALVLETCTAGGFIDDFSGNQNSVVVVSSGDPGKVSDCVETSWPATYEESDSTAAATVASPTGTTKVSHSRFTYWVNASFRESDLAGGPVSSDFDKNNLVSILENFDAVWEKIDAENKETDPVKIADLGGEMNPAISSPGGISPCVFIRLPLPGHDYEAFSMDHDDDDGNVPSVDLPQIPFDSPDLWLSDPSDGSKVYGPVNAGGEYNVHARVYNIGCADPGTVDVEFFTASLADCGDETKWTSIGNDDVQSLPVGESSVVHVTWSPTQGDYCLIGVLSAPQLDEPNEDKVAFDNNKAQIKIEVVAAPGI
jgi:hypothetical protein